MTMPMRVPSSLLVAIAAAAPLLAQNYYIPDNNAAAGACNVIPFGSTAPSTTWSNQIYQTIVNASDLGGIPNIITGISFAPCGTGSYRGRLIEVVLDHIPAGPLSTTFASNLTPNAVTVLSAPDYVWHTTGNSWMEIGLQNYFVYDGVSDLVVQVTSYDGTAPNGYHRDVRQRVYATSWTGSPPATGTSGNAAAKIGISMLTASASTYGEGCRGSNSLAPQHAITGIPQPGQGVAFQLQGALPLSLSFFVLGFTSSFPYPLDLGAFGAPGCTQYVSADSANALLTDAAGVASQSVRLPNSSALIGLLVWSQFACVDAGANQLGLTTSNYGRVAIGN